MKMRKKSNNLGFTLVELMVVVIIIGVLAAIAIPRYMKSLETSKADDAAATVRMIGNTNRMFRLDNQWYAGSGGKFPGICSGTCDNTWTSVADRCQLILCHYLASQDWSSKPYDFYTLDGDTAGSSPCGGGSGNYVACAKRCTTGTGCNNRAPYKNWGYTMDINGKIKKIDGAPNPPSGI